MKEQHCSYHIEGKKAPAYLLFKKSNSKVSDRLDELKLGDTKIRQKTEERCIGLNIKTKSDIPGSKMQIYRNGYVCEIP